MASKPDKVPSNTGPARGRTVAAKPLNSSATISKPRQASGAPTTKTVSLDGKSRATSTVSPKCPTTSGISPSIPPSSGPGTDAHTKTTVKSISSAAKPVPSASSSASKVPPPGEHSTSIEEQKPTYTSDPLQVAAQAYPWMYMTSTLEACFHSAEEVAKKDLEARSKQLEEQESDIAEQRIRFDAERAIDFYDELGTAAFAKEAPHIMQTFLSHGDACTRIEAEALQLAAHGSIEPGDDAPMQTYHDMLDSLEELHAQAMDLEASILRLTEPDPTKEELEQGARSQILGIFTACLPVVRARIANLSMAEELIDGAQENLSISLRMESLGLLG